VGDSGCNHCIGYKRVKFTILAAALTY